MNYELSVIIPSRNEEFLNRTIQDILEHKKGKTQIIVGLDGQWPVEPIQQHPDVVVLFYPESIGQRAITNQCVNLSRAKYILKCDAHVAFDDGFDVKMLEAFKISGDNVVMAPTMRNLHVFNWKCPDGHIRYQGTEGPCTEQIDGKPCGKPTVKDIVWIPKTNPSSTSYCFDPEPHFQYANEMKSRQWYKDQGDLTESMSLQGSAFMMTREKYWELDIGDETFGSWGSQGIQIACSFWLSGGRVLINHKTWYGHCFRTQGGTFGFPYPISGKQTESAKKLAGDKLKENKWPKQIHPSSWLIEKFWPVPGWKPEDLLAIGGVPTQEAEVVKEPSRGCIYYTDNQLNEKVMRACQKQLLKAAGKLPIVSVSLKPMDFGKNIVFEGERGYLTMTKQILTALEALESDIVYFTEHDILYHPSHFDFVPPDRNTWYYDANYWFLRMPDGFAISYDCSPLSGLVVYRDIAIKHFKERIALMEKDQFKTIPMYQIGFEPMTHHRIKWENSYPFKTFMSAVPSIDITHGDNVTKKRWSIDKFRRKPKRWVEGNIDTITGWDNVRRLLA